MAKLLLAKFYGVGQPLDLREVDTQQGLYVTKLRDSGFVDFVPSEQPMEQPGKTIVESLEMIDGKLVQTWSVQDSPEIESVD